MSTDQRDIGVVLHHRRSTAVGLLAGFGAYAWWGVIPLFFKLTQHMPALMVLGHRIVWSFCFFLALSLLLRAGPELNRALRSRRLLLTLFASACLVAGNWGTFIWAVEHARVLQASLGYFIAPFVSVALGMAFLSERLRAMQAVALLLAAAGVTVITSARGEVPWIAIALALTFGFYGLIRKTVPIATLPGLCVETALLLPAAAVMIWLNPGPDGLAPRAYDIGLLLACGPVTGLPLLAFGIAARRLRLSTIGFLQYVGPTGQFLLAVLAFKEPFGLTNLVGFILIWSALAIYSGDSLLAWRRQPDVGEMA